ncbi:zinc finger CCCH-type antiviral protein 1 isoform X1 [Monodelphis domestica]|uniref:zinc finger CCCH-type antiviral protein 1 isoform X1 n=1 Tax=Monodelphis domestica TaxID=13616 RepID=UPI0024E1E574|nr:zinc finger CCCH-type antiviral protein 1 isoform X1 [Monodelphis domestica]
MADPTVCDFLTRILCAHGGRMELRELLGHIELSETQVVEVLSEAGPERFMLLDQGPGTCPVVLATTSVRVCRRKVCEGQCEALHLCKLNLLDRCRFYNSERIYCKYSHDIHSEKNIRILKKHSLFTLSKKELGVLLLQSDPFFLPDICKHYKGENRSDSCSKKTECQRLHICEHFTQGKCGFEHCNRSHNLMDTKALELLREHGLTDSIIMNIQDIYNQKHAKNKKFLSGRKGQSNQRKRESRSQSRNRYFFETQELAPSPSALVGTSHIPGPDKTTPAPLPSFEGKAKESRTTTLSKDCAQSVSVSPKTSKTQEGCQAGTNSNVSVTSHRESRFGNQDGTQLAASTSPPFSTDKGSTPVRSSRVERKINMFFGSEDDSFSGPDLITTSKSGVMPSHNCANAGDDFGNQKAYSSPGLPKTVHVQGKGSNPVVFSKYKQTANGKKEDSSCKSKDNQSTLANPQMAKTATSIGKLETPIPNHSVANVSSTVRSRTFWNTHEQQHNLNKLADESLACQTDALNLNSAIIAKKDRKDASCASQNIQALPVSNTATASGPPKTSSASLTQSGIQKCNLVQPSIPRVVQDPVVSKPASVYKAAASPLSNQTVVRERMFSFGQVGSVSSSGSCQTSDTLTASNSGGASPSKSTNAEDCRARVSNTTPSEMESNDSTEICLDFLHTDCKLQERCKNIHFHLPYRWQLRIANNWKDFKDMEDIEKAYCDPNISQSHSIDFQKMTFGYFSVRRLSTPSTIQKPDYALSTEWLWYWKDELDQWIEYGKEESFENNSRDLEVFSQIYPMGTMEFKAGHHSYLLNFKEMIQTNILYHTKREVRRRPKFVSSVTVYWTKKQGNPQSDQSKAISIDFPSYWDHMALPQVGYKLLEVSRMSNEYVVIDFRFKSTMKNFEIQKIMRNQNPSLWNKFQRKKKMMLSNGEEKILFHATDQTRITSICTFSFDYSYQSLHEAKYGKGIYFAKEASSSHNNHKSSAKKKIMFVAQVLVGIMAEGKETHRPPELTIVDNINNPSIFVIFDSHQVYPEYVIEYTDIDKACSIS